MSRRVMTWGEYVQRETRGRGRSNVIGQDLRQTPIITDRRNSKPPTRDHYSHKGGHLARHNFWRLVKQTKTNRRRPPGFIHTA